MHVYKEVVSDTVIELERANAPKVEGQRSKSHPDKDVANFVRVKAPRVEGQEFESQPSQNHR